MKTRDHWRSRALASRVGAWALACAMLTVTASMLRAQTGAVAGRITDAGTGVPVRNVQIGITGTSLTAITDVEGRYRVANVPTSAREVTAKRIGYKPGTATFAMTAGANVTPITRLSNTCIPTKPIQ